MSVNQLLPIINQSLAITKEGLNTPNNAPVYTPAELISKQIALSKAQQTQEYTNALLDAALQSDFNISLAQYKSLAQNKTADPDTEFRPIVTNNSPSTNTPVKVLPSGYIKV